MVPLSAARRMNLAQMLLTGGGEPTDGVEQRTSAATREVEQRLGPAASNPMLFTMALELLDSMPTTTSRSDLLRMTLGKMAERTGAADIEKVAAVLGLVFAGCWTKVGGSPTPSSGNGGSSRRVRSRTRRDPHRAARGSGECHPQRTDHRDGTLQSVSPVHDLFADYMAGGLTDWV